MNVVALVQARMSSTRLPGKVLADINGRPMLEMVVSRVRRARSVDRVAVATSTSTADDAIDAFCRTYGVDVFRGSESDVLDRYWQAALAAGADTVIRVTADCPLIDPAVIDFVVEDFERGGADYVSNTIARTFPDGLDVEVMRASALYRAWREAALQSEREHVTPYIWKNPALFPQRQVTQAEDLSALRWTVDEPRDLELVRELAARLAHTEASMADVLSVIRQDPTLADLNAQISSNAGYLRSVEQDAVLTSRDVGRTTAIGTGQALYRTARRRIPGGTQLLSKRPEMFLPGQWPSYYRRARGVEVWDLDGHRYLDMSYNGIGACILGAADPDVDSAVRGAIEAGTMSTLNCPEELELAELLIELHPWAEMVRYARSGGEAMALAVRVARAHTRRDRVAFCGYHGWHDWYLAANLAEERALDGHLLPGLDPAGVPRGLIGTALPFRYNELSELEAIVQAHGTELGTIVMEPIRDRAPAPGFLEGVRTLADELGAVLVFDEITSGFRLNSGGAHLLYSVRPDIAVFAKGISNGYPMAAVIGRAQVMQAAQDTFISSTYWTDRIGPTAAIATITKHRRCDVAPHLIAIGQRIQEGWKLAGERAGIQIEVGGIPPLSHFVFVGADAAGAQTLFTQSMLHRGYLAAKGCYATYAHTDQHVDAYMSDVEQVFRAIATARAGRGVLADLDGPVAHSGFHRLT